MRALLALLLLLAAGLAHADGFWRSSGGVTGAASSVDNAIVRFDGTGGKTIQDYTSNAPTCGDTGVCTFVAPALGTPASVVLTNATGLPEAGLSLTDITTNNASATAHGFVPKWPNNTTTFFRGDGTYAAPAGGASTLDGITAATADQAGIANADWNIRWNWAKVVNSEDAFTFGESAAATGGTSTGGVPNQVLLKLATVANSTMSPLSVYSRAGHVFSVSPSTRQIFAFDGSASVPAYGFASTSNAGMSTSGGSLLLSAATAGNFNFYVNGSQVMFIDSAGGIFVGAGSIGNPVISSTSQEIGFYWPSSTVLGITDFTTANQIAAFSSGLLQVTHSAANAVGFSLQGRKSRGLFSAPTVITTGDDLLTLSGFGYVGAENTYLEAAKITFDSTGTVSDATTGIGGNIVFSTRKQGVDTAAVSRFQIDQHGHPVAVAGTANTPVIGTCGTTPSVTGTDDTMVVTVGTGGAATSCGVTFGTVWVATTVVCNVNSDTDALGLTTSATTTALTITKTAAFTASSKLNVMCRGIL